MIGGGRRLPILVLLSALLVFCVGSAPWQIGAWKNERVQIGGKRNAIVVSDTLTWVFRGAGHTAPNHSEWVASPDSSILDTDGTKMAHANVHKTNAANCDYLSNVGNNRSVIEGAVGSATARFSLMWFDLDLLPSDITITSAKLCVYFKQTVDFSDGIYVTLDTADDDTVWLDAPAVTSDARRRQTCWSYSNCGTESAWNPSLDDRDWTWQFGHRSLNGGDITAEAEATYDVTRAVQLYLDGFGANAGFWFHAVHAAESYHAFYSQTLSGADTEKEPFLKVTFATNRDHRQPWNGYPLAFVMTIDDGLAADLAYADTADARGIPLSICVIGDRIGTTADYLSRAQIVTLSANHEIASHSYSHTPTWGLQGCADLAAMQAEVDRAWLADSLGVAEGGVHSLCLPIHAHNVEVYKALSAEGYRGARDGLSGIGPKEGAEGYGTDLGEPARRLKWYGRRNIFTTSIMCDIAAIAGLIDEDPTEAMVRARLDSLAHVALEDSNTAMIIFAHDVKDGTGWYTQGFDTDELGWTLDWVQDDGRFWTPKLGELFRYYRAKHTPVDPPEGSDSATEGVTAADRIYWE